MDGQQHDPNSAELEERTKAAIAAAVDLFNPASREDYDMTYVYDDESDDGPVVGPNGGPITLDQALRLCFVHPPGSKMGCRYLYPKMEEMHRILLECIAAGTVKDKPGWLTLAEWEPMSTGRKHDMICAHAVILSTVTYGLREFPLGATVWIRHDDKLGHRGDAGVVCATGTAANHVWAGVLPDGQPSAFVNVHVEGEVYPKPFPVSNVAKGIKPQRA
jgi:hypothetical protein